MKKRTGVIILVIGVLCMIGAVVSVAVGVMGFVDDLKPVTIVEAPGGTEFQVDEPGTYTLWHDYSNWHDGSFHHYDRQLPPGFTFTLTHLDSGRIAPFTPLGSSTTQTMNAGQRESVGLGTFQAADSGPHKLEASNPASDQRFVSLTQGSFMSSFGSFGASFGIAALLGIVGIALLIAGFIGVLAGRKRQSAGSPPPPPAL